METKLKQVLLLFFLLSTLFATVRAESENADRSKQRAPPLENLDEFAVGTGNNNLNSYGANSMEFDSRKVGNGKVSVLTVALCTLAMAAATGLGAVPFFFVDLDPQWAGLCNGLAAGVMLAASFDLIQEGNEHGQGNWVMVGILTGGLFIWLCKKILEQYGEVSMLDIKGADATKVVLVIGIMTTFIWRKVWRWSLFCRLKGSATGTHCYCGYCCAQHTRRIGCQYGAGL